MAEPLPRIAGLVLTPSPPDRLLVSFSYNPDNVARIKQVPGRRWHADTKCWSVPHTTASVSRLQALFMSAGARPASGGSGSLNRGRSKLTPEESAYIEPVDQELRLRGYSRHTQKTYRNHLLRFRRYLQRDPSRELREKYAKFKKDVTEQHPSDRKAYTEGKHSFIRGIVGER